MLSPFGGTHLGGDALGEVRPRQCGHGGREGFKGGCRQKGGDPWLCSTNLCAQRRCMQCSVEEKKMSQEFERTGRPHTYIARTRIP